jgi:hypothetical protein
MRDFEKRKEERRARWEMRMEHAREHNKDGHIWTGALLLLIGAVALAKSLGVIMPPWLFSWQMLLIVIGLFIGAKKGFKGGGWFVPLLIGAAFLANEYAWHGQMYKHIWPIILIILGIMFLFRPKRKWEGKCFEKKSTDMNTDTAASAGITSPPPKADTFSEDDYLNTTSIFGGTEKTILSKNFKGGSMVNIFGGSEINLTQADINGIAVLDVTAIFGGATLIVPSNWVVKSDALTIFGGISDKRSVAGYSDTNAKNLILKGTVLFGGLEIKSY